MTDPAAPSTPTPPVPSKGPDLVFAALGEPVRRRILCALASGVPRTATELMGASGRRLDATLKHLVSLRKGGLIDTADNPRDGRRQLYILSAAATVTQTPAGREIDFGCCVVRL